MSRSIWQQKWRQLKRKVGPTAILFLFLIFFVSTIDSNYLQPDNLIARAEMPVLSQIHEILLKPFSTLGRAFLINTKWRLYSPVWIRNVWIEWYAILPTGEKVSWPTPLFDLTYRERTSTLELEFFQMKEPKIQSELTHLDRERASYGRYLCRQFAAEKGFSPVAMKPVWREFTIPPPNVEWQVADLNIDRFEGKREVPCR
jgi:hypothetical protein